MSAFPDMAGLLPQAGPMRLLARVLAHEPAATRCEVEPGDSGLFAGPGGRVPCWVALEYMAQCAAAHAGLLARARGEGPRPGLCVGSRRLVFRCDGFEPGRPLQVTARHAAGGGTRVAFDCAVLDPDGGPPLAEGRLNVFLPPDLPPAVRDAAGGGDRL